MSSRRVVFVVGSGRSGTSTMAGTLRTLGLHVPQPEVVADATNPKGFGEPRWVVDLHTELLARSNVQVSDARPRAWLDTGTTSGDHATRERVAAWLEEQLTVADELVIRTRAPPGSSACGGRPPTAATPRRRTSRCCGR